MERLLETHKKMVLIDALVAKALVMNELSQMAQIEKRLYELYTKTWHKLADTASNKAATMVVDGKKAKDIIKMVDDTMNAWTGAVSPIAKREMRRVYSLGRKAGLKKKKSKNKTSMEYPAPENVPISKASDSFDLVDEAVIASLNEHQVFWIGKFYDDGVSPAIAEIVRENIIQQGVSPKVAGDLMSERIADGLNHVELPSGWKGTTRQYMEGLTANAMTTGRVHGQMRSFAEIGITYYRIVNPGDSRTCPVCDHMDGKVFTLRQGTEQMSADLNSRTPEDVKNIHPWVGIKDLEAISPKPGRTSPGDSKTLANAGLALPTYHFRCRCTVDVEYESVDYDSLEPMPMSIVPSPIKRMKNSKDWANSLSRKHAGAIRDWTTNHETIRSTQLRKRKLDEAIIEKIELIREALVAAPKYKGTIYRSVSGIGPKEVKKVFATGNFIRNETFSSWTKSKTAAEKGSPVVVMKLKPTEGAFDISDVSSIQGEQEVLLEQGQMLKVISLEEEIVADKQGGKIIYYVTLAGADNE